ncbi:MAG: adenine deaminase, partial [Candidatus Altiarchaeales archaeon]|nr:adenine deaminase [Candidatus Altiarchaeales archaeon]
GRDLKSYVAAGMSTDHECFTVDEALEKISLGMRVQIREGSAARNFDELIPLVEEHYEMCMFCSDDKHPDDLLRGHINELVRRAAGYGIDVMKVLWVACVSPVLHYGLDVGLLQEGDYADFLEIDNLDDFSVLKTYINGEVVAGGGRSLLTRRLPEIVNNFRVGGRKAEDFVFPYLGGDINVIEALDGQIVTNKLVEAPRVVDGCVVSDVRRDILKMAVVNRYREAKVAVGFVRNFGLGEGAFASSVAHDSHNVIVVGVDDADMCRAVNLVIGEKGGISAVSGGREMVLPLPVAGIMSCEDYSVVAERYARVSDMAKSLGSTLHAPFMTLSFMALLVIPEVKLSDRGLFDGQRFEFIDVFVEV